ncbi:hypothetical protein LMJ53_05305 [Rheinheimera sp. UJ51]|uniref:PepSY domain-containing protein n=1 Tax=Rheinheimera sp. UJ51 TaxID=2892446 RepID=UPI001E5AECB9|nr:hypothetical protein [Rheinheimera sp. UJ51]MCC5451147.1 hypothetical protein [Rheinheimera sp. UJ51]
MTKILTFLLSCSLLLVLVAPVQANDSAMLLSDNKEPAKQPTALPTKDITKETAAQLAQQRFPGRILKVRAESRQYRVRVMQDDGRVVNVIVDGRSGRVKRED